MFYIQKPINQSQIRIGEFGLARHSPDHFAWEVFNELWGGGGTSRLFRTVRTELGLAYSVGSGFSEPQERGLIVAVSQTRGSQTIAAANAILKINQDVREAPFTPQEISDAKESIRNRFVENFTSSEQIASYMMNLEYFGFPADYLETYTQNIERRGAGPSARGPSSTCTRSKARSSSWAISAPSTKPVAHAGQTAGNKTDRLFPRHLKDRFRFLRTERLFLVTIQPA